jgi:hypothetical protein
VSFAGVLEAERVCLHEIVSCMVPEGWDDVVPEDVRLLRLGHCGLRQVSRVEEGTAMRRKMCILRWRLERPSIG